MRVQERETRLEQNEGPTTRQARRVTPPSGGLLPADTTTEPLTR